MCVVVCVLVVQQGCGPWGRTLFARFFFVQEDKGHWLGCRPSIRLLHMPAVLIMWCWDLARHAFCGYRLVVGSLNSSWQIVCWRSLHGAHQCCASASVLFLLRSGLTLGRCRRCCMQDMMLQACAGAAMLLMQCCFFIKVCTSLARCEHHCMCDMEGSDTADISSKRLMCRVAQQYLVLCIGR